MAGFNDAEKKPKDPGPLTKHGWEIRRIKSTAIRTAVSLVAFAAWYRVRYLYKGIFDPVTGANKIDSNYKYPYQLTCIILFVSLFMLFLALRKIVPKTVKDDLKARFGRFVSRYIGDPLGKLASKLRKIFGLPEHQRIGGEDEHSYIFDLEGNNLFRRFQSVKNQLRWRDLETNAEKIRFLYIKFVVKLIKGGYKYSPQMTSEELKKQLALKNEPEKLFNLYSGARYSGGRYEITDADVEMSEKLVKKHGV